MPAIAYEYKILMVCMLYFGSCFAVAWLTHRQPLMERFSQQPLVQMLALGVFVSAWGVYGIVDLFHSYGYSALAYYLGASGLFVFASFTLIPLYKLVKTYQLQSLSDLFVFRYRSPWLGKFVAICLILCSLPLMALQIQVIADTSAVISFHVGTTDEPHWIYRNLALIFCGVAALFGVCFGASRKRHSGLVVMMALESLLKIAALLAAGAVAVWYVFGGFDGLNKWLLLHPEHSAPLYQAAAEGGSVHLLVMLFFSAVIAFPHMFQISFVENNSVRTLRHAVWGIPLLLLLLGLPILPILWAGFEVGSAVSPDYFSLGVPLTAGKHELAALMFVGGLAAAFGSVVLMSVAIASLSLNHLLLPLLPFYDSSSDLYRSLIGLRRVLICVVIAIAYGFYSGLDRGQTLTDLVFLSCIGSMQLLPAVLAALYSNRINRQGVSLGLALGVGVWLLFLWLPTLFGWLRLPLLEGLSIKLGMEYWAGHTLVAIALNGAAMLFGSRLFPISSEELRAAEQCTINDAILPLRINLDVKHTSEIESRLAEILGRETAEHEVHKALADLAQAYDDNRAYALRRLRDRLEANLSGLLGTAVAHAVIDRAVPYHAAADEPLKEDLHFVESRLNQYRHHMTGMAAELDTLRRHHRNTLQHLPMALCSFSPEGEVLLWNAAMEQLTGINTERAQGTSLNQLPPPWAELIGALLAAPSQLTSKQSLVLDGATRWFGLHQSQLSETESAGSIVMIEDLTENERLQQELLHSERLASIGRLAAGVAHEVGNPVTGIACLAQDLKFEYAEPGIQQSAAQILGQTKRISRIVQSLVHFAHAGSGKHDSEPTTVDLFECVEEAIHLLSLHKDQPRVHFNNMLEPDSCIDGNEQTLTQLFINLLANARDASPPDSPIDISPIDDPQYLVVSVRDFGSGIEPQYLQRLFEPFFTTKPAGKGTGLGLALVYSIVEDHRGQIDVKSPVADGCGTEFILRFPKIPASQRANT